MKKEMEKAKGFWSDFKEFAVKGKATDMAIGVVIGAAFGSVVSSLVADIITPLIGMVANTNFTNFFVVLKPNDAYNALSDADKLILEKVQETGAPLLTYGNFVTALINFLLISLSLFIVIRSVTKATARFKKQEEEAAPTEKDCPYCLSKISIKATRCPHCTSELK